MDSSEGADEEKALVSELVAQNDALLSQVQQLEADLAKEKTRRRGDIRALNRGMERYKYMLDGAHRLALRNARMARLEGVRDGESSMRSRIVGLLQENQVAYWIFQKVAEVPLTDIVTPDHLLGISAAREVIRSFADKGELGLGETVTVAAALNALFELVEKIDPTTPKRG